MSQPFISSPIFYISNEVKVPNRSTNIDKHGNTSNKQMRTTVHQGHAFWTCRQIHACKATQGEKRDQRRLACWAEFSVWVSVK